MHCSKGKFVYLVLMGLLCASCRGEAECKKGRSPLDELPPYIRQVTKFGQRVDWSQLRYKMKTQNRGMHKRNNEDRRYPTRSVSCSR